MTQPGTPGASTGLVGRDAEVESLRRLLRGVEERGAVVLLRGEPGIGKSALLCTARTAAGEHGVRTLSTTGVEAESTMPFAALHQLVQPLLGRLNALPAPQRRALRAAFGMTDDASPELFLIGMAALTLISDSAADQPVLLLVDDAHLLDRPSAEVLAFVGRRLESEPVVMVVAQRDGFPRVLDGPGPVECRLERLEPGAAEELLALGSPGLDPVDRRRLLEEAAGNPLALVELPRAGTPVEGVVPSLTDRLEQAFAARFDGLPAATQTLLLVAALNEDGTTAESFAAAADLVGEHVPLEVLSPALEAQLVVSGGAVTFRHPLVRHAIRQRAGEAAQQRAHQALARAVGDVDRGIGHRAAACQEPDDAVADELEAAAARARRRGGVAAAEAVLERAARRTADPVRRADRYLRATQMAYEWGRQDVVDRLLRETAGLELPTRQRSQMTWIRASFDEGIHDVRAGTWRLAEVAASAAAEGQTDLALTFLYDAALRCWWAEPGQAARDRVVAVAEQLPLAPDDPRLLAVLAFAATLERGRVVLDRLPAGAGRPADVDGARLAGNAATAVGAFDVAVELLTSTLPGLRLEGRLGLLARALVLQAWSALHLGRLELAATASDEAARMATDTSQPLIRAVALVIQSRVAALAGDATAAEGLAAEAEQAGVQVGSNAVLAAVQTARGAAALGAGHHQAAWEHLVRVFDPADPAHHLVVGTLHVADLVEAAVHSGRTAEVRPVVAHLEAVAERTPSPALHVGLRHARALLAPDDRAEGLVAEALAADLAQWPLARARLQLAHGAWLRRRRRSAESRAPLRAARDTFDALGTVAWGDRARQELRASGEKSRARTVEARDQLSPQELLIAQLAAEGLTNREIGTRLYLSHRTIGTHLHRIFPKLGITSRVALGAAIGA